MTIIPTLNAQGPSSGEDGDRPASPGNEEAAKCQEPPAEVELIDHSIVMDASTLLNHLVRAHPIRAGGDGQISFRDTAWHKSARIVLVQDFPS